MNNRPNIFDYATKELSQDAMVCWLLKCCHSESERYKNIGYDFVRFILGDDYAAETDIELEKNSPYAQYYHMDVYANVRVGDKIIPIIFEDKTNTFLHGSQEKRYTDMVNGWKNDKKWTNELFDNDKLKWSENTWYVFFKTGYVFNWQKDEIERIKAGINAKVKTVFIDDKFIALAKKYIHIEELTPEVLLIFVSKIVIHERSEKRSKSATQQIDIYFTHIGNTCAI